MDNKKTFLFIGVILIVGLSVFYFSYNFYTEFLNTITGNAVAQGGKTSSLGTKQATNPTSGALKGRFEYIINDNEVNVDVISAESTKIYFTETGNNLADYAKVKNSDKKYKGDLNNIDADGAGNDCSPSSFTTKLDYYDDNNNNIEDQGEFSIYTVITDSGGCYAVKLPAGTYDIYV